MEQWRDIKGYEGLYIVSSYGRIKSIKPYISKINKHRERKTLLKFRINAKGYYNVNLYHNKIMKRFSVHRLVLMAFVANPENKPQCNHKDGNKLNNDINNLEWTTAKENVQHYFKYIYNGERKGLNHKPHKKMNDSFFIYKIILKNLLTNKTIIFNCLREASVHMDKRHNYLSNWLYKKKPIYKNKQYSWNIKEDTI